MKSIDLLLEDQNLTLDDLSQRSQLPLARVEAIALGRWTPSPSERVRLAKALGVEVDSIAWGHTMDPRNIRYRRFGLRENF